MQVTKDSREVKESKEPKDLKEPKEPSVTSFRRPVSQVGTLSVSPENNTINSTKETIINNVPTSKLDMKDITTHPLMDDAAIEQIQDVPDGFKSASIDNLIDIPQSEIKDYLDYLSKFGITKDQIFSVLDTLLTKGDVLWSFKLFSKINVVFRIRPYFINDILFSRLEESPPKTIVAFNDIVAKYNLAGALIQYDTNKFVVKDENSFTTVLDFIKGLPFIVVAHLIRQLAIFDRVIGVATSQWCIENFTKPQQGN
jgi:hypothetical protein